MEKLSVIRKNIKATIGLKQKILQNKAMLKDIEEIACRVINTYKSKGKVLFCGNGGSAADAQHLAAELSGRYYFDRPPLPAEALHVNTSYLTAVANDYSFDRIYQRIIEAAGEKDDILIGLSTSGNSENILKALEKGKEKKMFTVGLSGETGGKMKDFCDIILKVPSTDTPRIQECHMLIGHTICEIVEKELFSNRST